MAKYIVAGVGTTGLNAPKQWNSSNGGPMVDYKLRLQGVNQIVSLSQKATSPAPKKGDEIEGTIDMGNKYGPKLTRQFGSRGGYSRDTTAIRAQFAIKTAAQLYGDLPEKVRTAIEDPKEWIESRAKEIYAMVDRVKAVEQPAEKKSEDDGFSEALTDTFGDGLEDLTSGDDGGGF